MACEVTIHDPIFHHKYKESMYDSRLVMEHYKIQTVRVYTMH